MKIGVISDTHGDYESTEKIFSNFFNDVELIVHAGDILNHGPRNPIPRGYDPIKLSELFNSSPVIIHFAKGNCDSDVDTLMINNFIQAPYLFLNIEGIKILITHGDKNLEYYQKLSKDNVDILITGHTHNYLLEKNSGYIMLNPGSPSLPKNHHNGTCGIINTNTGTISIYDIKENQILAEINF